MKKVVASLGDAAEQHLLLLLSLSVPATPECFEPKPPVDSLVNFGRCTNIYWGLS